MIYTFLIYCIISLYFTCIWLTLSFFPGNLLIFCFELVFWWPVKLLGTFSNAFIYFDDVLCYIFHAWLIFKIREISICSEKKEAKHQCLQQWVKLRMIVTLAPVWFFFLLYYFLRLWFSHSLFFCHLKFSVNITVFFIALIHILFTLINRFPSNKCRRFIKMTCNK